MFTQNFLQSQKSFSTNNNIAHDITEYTDKFKQILNSKLSNNTKFKIIFDAQLKDQETSYHLFYNESVFNLFIESDLSSDLKLKIFFRAFNKEKETTYMLFKNSRIFNIFINSGLSSEQKKFIIARAFEIDKALASELLIKSNRNARNLEKQINFDLFGTVEGGIRVYEADIDPQLELTKPNDTFQLFMDSNIENSNKLEIILNGIGIDNKVLLQYMDSKKVFEIFINSELLSEQKKQVILKLFEIEFLGICFADTLVIKENLELFLNSNLTWQDKKEVLLKAFVSSEIAPDNFVINSGTFELFINSNFPPKDKAEIMLKLFVADSQIKNASSLYIFKTARLLELFINSDIDNQDKLAIIFTAFSETLQNIIHFCSSSSSLIIQNSNFSQEEKTKIFMKIIEWGEGFQLVGKTEYFDLSDNWNKYFNSIKESKRAKSIFDRMYTIEIDNFEIIFSHLINNKKKYLLGFFDKLITAKEIGLKTNFASITKMLDINLMLEITENTSEQKQLLIRNYSKLLDLTNHQNKTKKLTEFTRFLQSHKILDQNVIGNISVKFSEIFILYFEKYYERKLIIKIKSEIKKELLEYNKSNFPAIILDKIDKNKILDPLFIETFKIYLLSVKNKKQLRELIIRFLAGDTNLGEKQSDSYPYNIIQNIEWIDTNLPGKSGNIWLSRNEKTYRVRGISERKKQEIIDEQIEHHFKVSQNLFENLFTREFICTLNSKYPKIFIRVGDFVNYFNTEFKPKKDELHKLSRCSDRIVFDGIFNDILLQIKSIQELKTKVRAKSVRTITIYKELDPMRVMMMGNWVNNSCLSFYDNSGNSRSAVSNAVDINKGVFYIEDDDGNIIGRVLTAIDEDNKLLRFGMYYNGNIGADLNKYFDKYIRNLTKQMKIGIGGNKDRVQNIVSEEWYIDPVYEIK